MVFKVLFERLFKKLVVLAVVYLNVFKFRCKGGVAAVVAPVGVQHPNLRHARVTMLFVLEIVLNMFKVGQGHGQAQGVVQVGQFLFAQRGEPFQYLNVGGLVVMLFQGVRLWSIGHSAVHGVHAVLYNFFALHIAQRPSYHISRCRANNRLFGRIEQPYTLHCTVGTLVELSWQVFNSKHEIFYVVGKFFFV